MDDHGSNRGFGFVRFAPGLNHLIPKVISEMNGKLLEGMPMKVSNSVVGGGRGTYGTLKESVVGGGGGAFLSPQPTHPPSTTVCVVRLLHMLLLTLLHSHSDAASGA